MKKLIVILLFLVSPFLVSAQIDSQDVFRIQNVDINFSTLTLDTMNIEAGLHYLNYTIGNISIIPSDTGNYTNVTIKTWNTSTDCLVSFNESSTNHTNTAAQHTLTNPCWVNKLITINKNSIPWNTYLADSNGMISFNYTDGYSDVQFGMQPATDTTISCMGWCYLAQNYTSSTLRQIDTNNSNDTVHSYFNASSQKWESHRTGYKFNENINVPQKWGYAVYFSSTTNVNVIYSYTSISPKSGWNLIGNMNTSARTLSALKTSIGANATAAQYYNRTSMAWETGDSIVVPAGESFFAYLVSTTPWSD